VGKTSGGSRRIRRHASHCIQQRYPTRVPSWDTLNNFFGADACVHVGIIMHMMSWQTACIIEITARPWSAEERWGGRDDVVTVLSTVHMQAEGESHAVVVRDIDAAEDRVTEVMLSVHTRFVPKSRLLSRPGSIPRHGKTCMQVRHVANRMTSESRTWLRFISERSGGTVGRDMSRWRGERFDWL